VKAAFALRSSSFGATAFAATGLAEPKLAKPAKAGGARRDRTADLLHAMQALSQLSYGPVHLRAMALDQIAVTLYCNFEHGPSARAGGCFWIMLSHAPWATRGEKS
jgi:hypothetical protein